MKKYTIQYTYQCDNKWDEMVPQDNGRHCASCNKIVVDFTRMPDQDIVAYLLKNTHTCGLFKKNQLNRPMVIYSYEKRSNWSFIAAMLVAGLFSVMPAQLNANPVSTPAIEWHSIDDKKVEPDSSGQDFRVQLINSNTKIPVLSGSIYIEGIGNFFGNNQGIVDIPHNFSEKNIPDSLHITITAGGYTSKVFTIPTKNILVCNQATVYLDEIPYSDISPPGTVAIYEVDTPQTEKKCKK